MGPQGLPTPDGVSVLTSNLKRRTPVGSQSKLVLYSHKSTMQNLKKYMCIQP